jgi:hypothetical protein
MIIAFRQRAIGKLIIEAQQRAKRASDCFPSRDAA